MAIAAICGSGAMAVEIAISWDLTLENLHPAAPRNGRMCDVLAALEQQLVALDKLGAHIAAAHVDAAIHQLRRDQAKRD